MTAGANSGVVRDDVLFIPKRRRLTHAWINDDLGQRQLYIYYGIKEICFDDATLIPFGEQLLAQERFRAEDATKWAGDAATYDWERVKELLDTLVEEGVLSREAESTSRHEPRKVVENDAVDAAALVAEARTWSAADRASCPVLMQAHVGASIELEHLEIVVPVYRVAHPALDADRRQVGEANVAPECMRLPLPTERRACPYPGSRFQDDKGMNATALKLMMKHWDRALAMLGEVRARFFERAPQRGKHISVGELDQLVIATLAIPGYCLVRGEQPVSNGSLDAALATLFRIVDGVRMTTSRMLLEPNGAYDWDRPLTSSDEIIDYSERALLFVGTHGVCAGPASLMREFFDVLLGHTPAPPAASTPLATIVGDLDAAFDYAFAGLQVDCLVRALMGAQSAHTDALARAMIEASSVDREALAKVDEWLARRRPVDPAREEDAARARTYCDRASLEAARRWSPRAPSFSRAPSDILQRSQPTADECEVMHARARTLFPSLAPAMVERLVDVAAVFRAQERATLDALAHEQDEINARLGRRSSAPPNRAVLAARGTLERSYLGDLLGRIGLVDRDA